ncbi:MAG TPA: thiol reductant ABC exporter subunit CydC, partial [Longimicrobium sp.]|nr:thiol reductant ABC exporter subunit CydC [Longimicrobium sp.]
YLGSPAGPAADGTGDPGHAAALRCLAACAAEHLAAKHPAELSPGELRRVALARGLARIDAGARVLLLDEPTAHLDRESATAVSRAIAALRGKVTVLLVAHDRLTRELADEIVAVAPGAQAPAAATQSGITASAATASALETSAAGSATARIPAGVPAGEAARPESRPAAVGQPGPGQPGPGQAGLGPADNKKPNGRHAGTAGRTPPGSTATRLRRLLAPVGAKFAAAGAVGTLAALFAVALAGLSGWLIIRASEQPPILYLLTAIVGVRFFGIGRAALRYLERLLLHDAVFAALTRLRGRLWESLSRRALSLRRLLQGGNVLGTVVDDVDTVRELLPRVVLPPLTAVAVAAASVTGIALLLPAALPAVIAAAVLSLVAAPALALAADRMSAGTEQRLRSGVLRQVAAALDARAELHANGVSAPVLAAITRADRSATAASQRSAWAEGLGQGLTVLACGTAALASAVLAAPLALSGAVEASTVAVVVLLQLALVEPYAAITTAVRQYPALRAVLERIGEAGVLDDGDAEASGGLVPVVGRPGGRPGIELRDLAAAWPGGPPVFTGLTATAEPGRWLAVTGTSGSGKSTLLAVVLGFLPAAGGQILLGGRAAWCPQEAHLFDSTIRGNLLLGLPEGQRGGEPEARLQDALAAVGLGPLIGRLEHGLDTRIGPGGAFLSGGERQRLAVARTLLTGADVILLDEPTAHLDAESGRAMLAELRHGLRDRTVVLVTHNPDDIAADDSRLDLDRAAAAQAALAPEPTPLLARG